MTRLTAFYNENGIVGSVEEGESKAVVPNHTKATADTETVGQIEAGNKVTVSNGVVTDVTIIKSDPPLEVQKRRVRSERNQLLQQSDWRVTKALEQGTTLDSAWASYRQALRDITEQTGFPHDVTWPTEPTGGTA